MRAINEAIQAEAPSIVMLTIDRQIDRRILLEADSLEAIGWKVVILGMPLDVDQVDDDPRVRRIAQPTAISAFRGSTVLRIYAAVRRVLPMNGPLMRRLKSFAWRYFFDQEDFFTQLYAPMALTYTPAVFVAHDLPMLPVARIASERIGASLVYDSHELFCEQEFSRHERRRWAQIEKKHIGACKAVITVNPSIANELTHRYGLKKVHVIYNAESTARSVMPQRRFHEAFGLDRSAKILLFQGGLSAGRNIEALISAMDDVLNEDVHLVVMGDGQLKTQLKTIARSDRVHLHPAVSQHDLLDFTASADAGVIPYQATCLNNHYCTPNKLFEFIAAGLPILASGLPEIERIICTHAIGMTGDMSTPENIAVLVDKFFSDESRMQTWRTNVERTREIVCWEEEGKKVVEIFEAFR